MSSSKLHESRIELRALGAPRLSATDGRSLDSVARQSKRLALLVFLAAARPRGPHRRHRLLGMFWPDSDESRGRAALSQALYSLRSALGPRLFEPRGRDEVAVDGGVLWCDVAAFEDALDAGRIDDALSLYGGDFLEGFYVTGAPDFERWVDQERTRLRLRAADAAWALSEREVSAGDAAVAVRWARWAADLAPGDEAVARRLMLVLRALGDRSAAIRAYDAFVSRLAEEYGLEPSEETRAVAAQIRDEERGSTSALPPARREMGAPVVRHRPLPPIPPGRKVQRARWPVVVAALGVAAFGVTAAWPVLHFETPAPQPLAALPLDLDLSPPLAAGVPGSTVALSRDGTLMVYIAGGSDGPELVVRSTDRLEATAVQETRGATHPFFSPDGGWLAFVRGDALWKVRVDGGRPVEIADIDAEVQGASWADDETIVFTTEAGLWQVPADGGQPRLVARARSELGEQYRWPDALPGSRGVVLTIASPSGFDLATVSLPDGEVRRLGIDGTSPRFVEPGVLVFARLDETLLRVSFDPSALRAVGSVRPARDHVHVGLAGAAKVGVAAASGTLAYVPSQPENALYLVGTGGAEPVVAPGGWIDPGRFSPDGDVFFTTYRPEGIWPDIWAVSLDDGTMRRITTDSGSATPVPSHDGRRLAYASRPGGRSFGYELRSLWLDGSAGPETLLEGEVGQRPTDFTADDRGIVFVRIDPVTLRDVWVLWLDGTRDPVPYLQGAGNEHAAQMSRDGKWVAFVSDDSGREEVYLASFPDPSVRIRVTSTGGREPSWSPGGDVLYYRTDEGLMAAPVELGTRPEIGAPHAVFDDPPYVSWLWGSSYDVHPDGERFALASPGTPGPDLVLVLNWLERGVVAAR
jgi:DNA-binding SARP family transcriptional activator/Tol biopolymer transport system component